MLFRSVNVVPSARSFLLGKHQAIISYLHMASQVAQMVNNLPARQETWVQSLDWEDPLEKKMATQSNIQNGNPIQYSSLEKSMDRGAG